MGKGPAEVSSRKPIPGKRFNLVKRVAARDPRFDGLSGAELDVQKVAQAYAFVDDLRASEIAELRERRSELMTKLKKSKSTWQQQEFQEELAGIEDQLKQFKSQEERRRRLGAIASAKSSLRKEEAEKVASSGKAAKFHSRKEIRQKLEENKLAQLEKEGKKDRYLAKREKKQAEKEKRKLPTRF